MNENEKTRWFSVEIETTPEAVEAVEFALNELESLGTEINQLGKQKSELLKILGYFNEKIDDETVIHQLHQSLEIYGFSGDEVKSIEWSEVEDKDWLAEWKKHWKPTEVEKFIIAPTWEKIGETEKIVIYIEPNMAFGTGTHKTTKLCLRAIGENLQSGMSFFDVGTGTGILAIAASKLKAGDSKNERKAGENDIVGCDTDVDSVKIAKENALFNNVDDITFYIGSISLETAGFDFVCANLTADVILPILADLTKKTRRILVLSGILKTQQTLLEEKLKVLGITDFEVQTDGEWISIVIKK